MSKLYDIMVAGHLCLDVIPKFPDAISGNINNIFCPGKLVNVQQVSISTGGPVSNTGISMKTLGSKVCFCARIGDDQFGKIIIERLQNTGNAKGIHVVKNTASSYTIVLSPPGIDRIFLHNPASNDEFGTEDLDVSLIAQCRHFHFGYPPLMRRMYQQSGKTLEEVFKYAKSAGATVSCDMTLPDPASASGQAPWLDILKRILPYVDFFLPSIEEVFYMLEPCRFLEMKKKHNNAELIDHISPDDYSHFANELLAMGTKLVSLKSGHRGFYVKTGAMQDCSWSHRELWSPAYYVEKMAGAAGSGDSSIAGFLSGYLRGLSIEKCLKYAVCCGWQNVQVLDAVSGIKTWQETTQQISRKMPIVDCRIADKKWKWLDEPVLWAGPEDSSN